MKAVQFSGSVNRRRDNMANAGATFVFPPDTVLPFRYFEMFRRNPYREGEKRLMLAVLEDAVECFQKYYSAKDKKGRKLFQETDDWFRSKGPDWLFSFVNICQTLAINPEYVRWALLEWREREPLLKQCGQGKDTDGSSKKAGVLHRTEAHRASADSNHKSGKVMFSHWTVKKAETFSKRRLSDDQDFPTEFWGHSRTIPLTGDSYRHRAPAEMDRCPCRQKGGENQ